MPLRGKGPSGNFNQIHTQGASAFDAPRFIDNAIRHAVYTKVAEGFSVTPPVNSDFMPTHERKYKLVEEEDTVRLFHNPTESFNFEGPIFNDNYQMNSRPGASSVGNATPLPPLIIDSKDIGQRLTPNSITSEWAKR